MKRGTPFAEPYLHAVLIKGRLSRRPKPARASAYNQRTVVPVRDSLRRLRSNPSTLPLALIGVAILVVNLPTLLDLVTRNPVQLFAYLQSTSGHQTLPGSSIIDPNAGYITMAMGHLAAMDWLHGHIPWWNPYEGLGAPLAGEMQAGAFFPLVLLLQGALGFVVFHIALELTAGYATYFLLRRLDLGRAASTAGGVAFGLCGTLAWFEHATANPVAFLPLALLGVERARAASVEMRANGWRLLAVALALSIVAGFPEVAYLDGLLVAIWAAVRLLSLPVRRQFMLAKLAVGCAVGLLLSAPALVAFIDYLPHGNVGNHGGAFANGFLVIQNLGQTVLPYSFGPIFGLQAGGNSSLLTLVWGNAGGYLDATLIVCALIGLLGSRLRALRVALAVWIFLAMSKTFGVAAVSHLLNHFPGIHSTAFYRYSQASWEFAVVVLAALGIDDMAHRRVRVVGIVGAGALTLGAIAWAGWLAWPVLSSATGYGHRHAFAVASIALAVVGVAVVVTGGLLARSRGPTGATPKPRIGVLLVAAAITVEAALLFAAPLLSAPRPEKADAALVHYLQGHMGLSRFATLGPLQPNFGSFYDLAEINVNDLPVPKAFSGYITRSLDDNVDPLIFTGAAVTDPSGPTPADEMATHLAAYEAAGVKFVVTAATASDSPWPATEAPAPRRVYADSFADVWQLPVTTPFFSTSGAQCHVQPRGISVAQVTCSGPATLRRLELHMPGWRARDGSTPLTVRASGPFQSVRIGAGTHVIQFSFTPRFGALSLLATLIGLACIVVSTLLSRSRRRRSEVVSEPSSAS